MNGIPARPARRQPRRWSSLSRLRGLSPEVAASWDDAEKLIDRMKGDPEQDRLTAEECQILKTRWVDQTTMYERLWRGQRWVFYLVRVPVILLATTIPVLASLAVPKEVTAFVGLAVAILTALDSFFQLGSRWQQHRHAATELGFEGWQFVELSGAYAGKKRREAYQEFMTDLEAMNKKLATSYLDLFRASAKTDGKKHST
jgi:ABC-type multidrug transport system fused ATPase/permease subunit